MQSSVSLSTAPKHADNANEEDVDSGTSSDSEKGMDEILRDLIEAQERLHERDQELNMKNKELEGIQELVHTLTVGLNAEDLKEEDEASAAELQRTVNRLTTKLEEKDRQLRAKDWDMTTMSEEKVLLEAILKKQNQDLERPAGVLSEKIGIMRQERHGGKVKIIDVDGGLEGLVAQSTESDGKDVAELRLLVEFFKSNSEKVAIKNRELLKEIRSLNNERRNGGSVS